MKILLPKRENTFKTGETDPVELHYLPVLSYFMNKRLAITVSLIKDFRFDKILDAGCGGGISFPELSKRAKELHGVDIHGHLREIEAMAKAEGIKVTLKPNPVDNIDYPDETFDCVFCLSVLEFVPDIDKAMDELYRVTKKGGYVVLGFPVINLLTDLSYWLIKIKDARQRHPSSHQVILNSAKRRFSIDKVLRFPLFLPLDWGMFVSCRLKK